MSDATSVDTLKGFKRFALYALAMALLLAGAGIYLRVHAQAELTRSAEHAARLVVLVAVPKHGVAGQGLELPGTVQAYNDAPIYARTSGYLKRWYADIGQAVQAGELLAEIETPEVDAQLRQAQADLATAHANNVLAQATAARYVSLLGSGTVSKQDEEQKQGDADAKKAAEESARENVNRLQQIKSFARVTAPFAGIISARRTDVGALVNEGSASGQELFHLNSTGKLRVYVQVPQSYVSAIKPGDIADLTTAEQPDRHYAAQIVRASQAFDSTTRTQLTELQVDNPGNMLLPGSYIRVRLPVAGVESWQLPANTLLFREGSIFIAVVKNDAVQLHKVQLGRDFGDEVEVLSGVNEQDRIILNPPDSLLDGAKVSVRTEGADGSAKASG